MKTFKIKNGIKYFLYTLLATVKKGVVLIKTKYTMINITNEDNMQLMARYKDNHFDLAIVDPPYGIGAGSKKFINRNTANKKAEGFYRDNDWDIKPNKEYFMELERVSKK